MSLEPHQRALLAELETHRDPQARLAWLVHRADAAPRLTQVARNDSTRVPGCLAQLWLVGEIAGDHCVFRCDSDSRIVRAVAGFVCDWFSQCAPEVAAAGETRPLEQAGLDRLLAANRRNAVSRVGDRIRKLAREFLAASLRTARRADAETADHR